MMSLSLMSHSGSTSDVLSTEVKSLSTHASYWTWGATATVEAEYAERSEL